MAELNPFHVEPDDAIDRRNFVRRLFAIGAGIAASGALVRAADAAAAMAPRKDAYEAWMHMYSSIDVQEQPDMIFWSSAVEKDYIELFRRREGSTIEVVSAAPLELADPERLAHLVIDDCMENRGGKAAIRAAMLDDVKYGGHGRIVVGKDLRARYEPVPIVHHTRMVEPWGFRGRSLMDTLVELNG